MEGSSSCFWKYLNDMMFSFSFDFPVIILCYSYQKINKCYMGRVRSRPGGQISQILKVMWYILSPGYILVRPPPPPPAPLPPPWHRLIEFHDKPPLKRLHGLPVPACERLALTSCYLLYLWWSTYAPTHDRRLASCPVDYRVRQTRCNNICCSSLLA